MRPETPELLVPLDGSRLAEGVLPLARAFAGALPAAVALLHVLEASAPSTVHGQPHLTTVEAATAYLEGIAADLRRAGLTVTVHVHADPERDVAASIAAHADERDVLLVALSAHGGGGLRGLLFGRVAEQVARRSRRPVLVALAPAAETVAIRRLLLPVTPVGPPEPVLGLTRRLCLAFRAELVLLTVVPTRGTVSGDAAPAAVLLPSAAASLLDMAEAEARAELERLATELGRDGIAASVLVERGDPAQELPRLIDATEPDLVVMATHAHAGLGGLLAGRVTSRVLAGTQRPLLLVPMS
ncbi:MAG TPA: universal stress protein [Chloroflexota bacterium]